MILRAKEDWGVIPCGVADLDCFRRARLHPLLGRTRGKLDLEGVLVRWGSPVPLGSKGLGPKNTSQRLTKQRLGSVDPSAHLTSWQG